jgi:hypothetical protein
MLSEKMIAVCFEIDIKHVNTLCGQKVEFFNVKELYALYSSPNIIRVIKSKRQRWAGHVARMGERRGAYRVLVGET